MHDPTRCDSWITVDDGSAVRCDLDAGHDEAHEHTFAGMGTLAWIDG